jgi:hypothetical protein
MYSRQLLSLLLPSVLVTLALIGLALLRSELQGPRKSLMPKKKKEGLLKLLGSKDRFRKAS